LHLFHFFDNLLLIMLDPYELGKQIREKRVEMHLTQKEFAQRFGLEQTAISFLETGKMDRLGADTIANLCVRLGIPFDPASIGTKSTLRRLVFCGTHNCPLSIPFVIHGRIAVQPLMFLHQGAKSPFCQWCGGPMLDGCSTSGCNAALVGGAVFCPGCREPLVKVPLHIAQHPDPTAYIDIQLQTRDRLLANRPKEKDES
jgi:transcriptional regulator with XRE-family HTH domain